MCEKAGGSVEGNLEVIGFGPYLKAEGGIGFECGGFKSSFCRFS